MSEEYRYLFRSDLVKMYHNLNRKIKKRIDNIRSYGGNYASQIAVERYDDLIQSGKMPRNIKNLSERELRQLIAELRYIDSLKSSHVKGALFVRNVWDEKVSKKLNKFNDETSDKFWRLFSLATEQPQMFQYRYEIAELITDVLIEKKDIDEETLLQQLDEAFFNATVATKRKGEISGTKLENEFNEIRTRFRK